MYGFWLAEIPEFAIGAKVQKVINAARKHWPKNNAVTAEKVLRMALGAFSGLSKKGQGFSVGFFDFFKQEIGQRFFCLFFNQTEAQHHFCSP